MLITRRGRPIARLVPHSADKTADPQWAASYERMMAQLEEGASLDRLESCGKTSMADTAARLVSPTQPVPG